MTRYRYTDHAGDRRTIRAESRGHAAKLALGIERTQHGRYARVVQLELVPVHTLEQAREMIADARRRRRDDRDNREEPEPEPAGREPTRTVTLTESTLATLAEALEVWQLDLDEEGAPAAFTRAAIAEARADLEQATA